MQFDILNGQGVTAPLGFRAGTARGGIKTQGDDVAILLADEGATCAAMFTSNQVKAAPLLVSQSHLSEAAPRAIVVNAGNANCATGILGLQNARTMAELAAKKLGISRQQVLVCSTGIIGHQLPMEKIKSAIEAIELRVGDDEVTARAFMTTDIVPKFFAASTVIGGKTVTVGGQCKGVGMIGPDLVSPARAVPPVHATMLAFLTTDAQIERHLLQSLLEKVASRTFNSVTIDGDTSTNDTVVLLASGQSDVVVSNENQTQFLELLEFVSRELAKKIARDGEGATKLIEISVSGAQTEADAKKIALTIANSPLVKTAIFGRDPNWGRIAMAAGRAGVEFSPADLSFSLGNVALFQNGEPLPFDADAAQAQLQGEEVTIALKIQGGNASWTAWTCDFSYDYVKINAEYHT